MFIQRGKVMKAEKLLQYPPGWPELAAKVKDFRGGKCEVCKTRGKSKHVLTVHHIDYKPDNCKEENLIVLCSKCHLKWQNLETRRVHQGIIFHIG